ncbi:MAG: DUF2218 domain-containing protein, partial [Bacteroidales bacterium]|nr:DUF2218 domain-containing protein [Bacteroidales bacterium]
MTEMPRLIANATAAATDPATVIAEVCEHFSEHDALIHQEGDVHVVTFPFGVGRLRPEAGAIALEAESKDITGLYYMRMALAGHVKELARTTGPDIVWIGDGSDLITPPNLRLVQVRAIRDISPTMRRITFGGDDLDRFATDESLHVGLLLPSQGSLTVPPTIGRDGLLTWPDGMESRRC